MTDIDEKKYNHVLEIIEKKLIPDEQAKKARGEVFTKLSLVREMILGIKKSSIEKGRIEIWGMDKEEQFIEEDEQDRVGGVPLQIFQIERIFLNLLWDCFKVYLKIIHL